MVVVPGGVRLNQGNADVGVGTHLADCVYFHHRRSRFGRYPEYFRNGFTVFKADNSHAANGRRDLHFDFFTRFIGFLVGAQVQHRGNIAAARVSPAPEIGDDAGRMAGRIGGADKIAPVVIDVQVCGKSSVCGLYIFFQHSFTVIPVDVGADVFVFGIPPPMPV